MAKSLQEEGFRFVLQDGAFSWKHPAEIKAGAVDCTDMPDEEFAALVLKVEENA